MRGKALRFDCILLGIAGYGLVRHPGQAQGKAAARTGIGLQAGL